MGIFQGLTSETSNPFECSYQITELVFFYFIHVKKLSYKIWYILLKYNEFRDLTLKSAVTLIRYYQFVTVGKSWNYHYIKKRWAAKTNILVLLITHQMLVVRILYQSVMEARTNRIAIYPLVTKGSLNTYHYWNPRAVKH